MRLNAAARNQTRTFEGAPAVPNLSPEKQLRRSVLSCLLWEGEFYEDGQTIAQRIAETAAAVKPEVLAALAVEAREVFHLRHVPLQLVSVLSRTGPALTADTTARVIQRADELAEVVAVYQAVAGRRNLPRQLRVGIQRAFAKFSESDLAKYDRDGAVKLRDVLRIARPKPGDEAQSALWRRVKERALVTPDTWEVALSGGADKKATFERLIQEGRLGYLALLRNLRNMTEAGVDADLVKAALVARKGARRVLPFRYVAAARAVPQFEPAIDQALCEAVADLPVLPGKTAVLVDVSGSMNDRLSHKSDMTRMDAAAALASIIPGDLRVFTFSNALVEVPPRRGMAGVDAVRRSQSHGGTYLGQAVDAMNKLPLDRLIVVTDEQTADRVPTPVAPRAYMVNVASARNGVGYGAWTHIDGFSEGVLRFIAESENDR